MPTKKERFISVDVETSGPIPGKYSLLSIGACDVYDIDQCFSCLVSPLTDDYVPEALEVSGLQLEELKKNGQEPKRAMHDFGKWVRGLGSDDERKVFVGFNASFDWSFVNYYFHLFNGENPFGFAALDIKSMYFGATGCDWNDTRSSEISRKLRPDTKGNHNALDDAIYQAELFRLIREKQS